MNNISPATHTWSSTGFKLAKCKQCRKETTGILKDVKTGKKQAFCSECAYKKGFR